MLLRKINRQDLPNLIVFSKKTFIEAFAHLNNPDDFKAYVKAAFTPERFENELNTEGVEFYCVEQNNEWLGYLKINIFKSPDQSDAPKFYDTFSFDKKNMLEVERIYVDSAYHGKGVAPLLMEKAISVAQNHHCSQIWLGVWNENPKAIRFYEKQGFAPIGEHIFTIGTDDQTDILMLKNLY